MFRSKDKDIIFNQINDFNINDKQNIYLHALIDVADVKVKSKRPEIDEIMTNLKKANPKNYSY